jgi:aminoglycoside 3-N-acetyltransferase
MISTLSAQLQDLGVRRGGVLLVHASLRSLRALEHPPASAEDVIQGLLDALGPDGTLLLPALSYASVTPAWPHFDVGSTPACIGALPEYFRTRHGTLRSIHPTHSVAGVGIRAAELLGGHELDSTPVGPHSPFSRLPGVGGQILFLGCGLRPNTSMHGVEELAEPPYLFGEPLDYHIRLADGSDRRMSVRTHNFAGWAQRYERIAELLQPPDLRAGHILHADCYLLEAAALWPAALAALRRDPLYFVESIA